MTLAALPVSAAAAHGEAVAIQSIRPCRWPRLSYTELAQAVEQVARGLLALGVGPGENVAILAETRVEWTVCGLAVAAVGATVVTVYPTNSAQECEWVLSDSGAAVLICEDDEQLAKIAGLRDRLPRLRHVVTMQPDDLDELLARGARIDPAELRRRRDAVTATDPSMIIYTSGTTGNPKGCVLTHGNWRELLRALHPIAPMLPGENVYLYLPLAHALAHIIVLRALDGGATLHMFGGDVRKVLDELAQVRPEHVPSVPRLFEKVHSRVLSMLAQAPAADREAFERALRLGGRVRGGETLSAEQMREFTEADGRWLSMVRGLFGGRVTNAVTGAAPIAPEILEFFHACGVPIYEGYGLTESSGVISLNAPGAVRAGTVGRPIDGVRVRIAEDGEILACGNMFAGYHANETATAEVLVDGWLHTGDLGELDEDGFLRVTGRKKELIIPASGKNISPNNIENDLRRSPWIAHAVLHGDRRPHLVALITLDAEEIGPWARARGLPTEVADLVGRPELTDLVQGVVDEVNATYSRPEQIRRFAVLDKDFSQDGGELTPTMKLRRAAIDAKYCDVLDNLYR